jgi:uncharacterized protein with HEPN domain
MSKRETILLLEDIIESIEKIERYTEALSLDQFYNDEKTVDAVVRNFEIIGEAAKQVSKTEKLKFIQIPWRKMVGLRNRIVHEYFGIDLNIVWQIKVDFLPKLLVELREIRNSLKG